MSGSEVQLLAQAGARSLDWRWLERWLADGLGLSVRAVVTAAMPGGTHLEKIPSIVYGDAEYCREAHRFHGIPVVEATHDDLFAAASRLPRTAARARGACPSEALLDRGLAALGRAIDDRYPELARTPRWPAPYRWVLVLTHDVDAVDRWTPGHVAHLARHVAARARHEGARAIVRLPWAFIRRAWDRPPIAQRLRACLALERQHEICATYLFFSPTARYREALDAWYTPSTSLDRQDTVAGFWREIVQSGGELGLHLSIGAHARPDAIEAEWASLQAYAPSLTTYRSHHLADAPGITLPTLRSVGGRIDLNLVSDGFAWGSGLPWRIDDAPDDFYRLPTVVEDSPLERAGASSRARDAFWDRCRSILEEAERNESVATVLLHPENPGSVEVLEAIVEWGRARGAWMTSATGLARHWRERSARLSLAAECDAARR